MSSIALYELSMIQETTLNKLTTLGVEYQGGHLAKERFCDVVLEILGEHQKAVALMMGKRRSAAQREQEKEKS